MWKEWRQDRLAHTAEWWGTSIGRDILCHLPAGDTFACSECNALGRHRHAKLELLCNLGLLMRLSGHTSTADTAVVPPPEHGDPPPAYEEK